MSAARKPALVIVGGDSPNTPADLLAEIVPQLIEAEATARRFRQLMIAEGRLLAAERGLKFIREEQLRQEFGNG